MAWRVFVRMQNGFVAPKNVSAATRVRRQARRINVTLRLGTGHRRPRPPMIRLAPQPCVAPWNLPPLTKNVRWRSAAFGDVPRATTAARDVPPPTAATRSDGFLSRESDCQFSRTGQLRGERRRSWPRGRVIPGSRGTSRTTQGEQIRRYVGQARICVRGLRARAVEFRAAHREQGALVRRLRSRRRARRE